MPASCLQTCSFVFLFFPRSSNQLLMTQIWPDSSPEAQSISIETSALLPTRTNPPSSSTSHGFNESPPPTKSPQTRSFILETLSILLGPLSCFAIMLLVDIEGRPMAKNALAALSWVFIWWLTNSVPMPITSMVPLFLFPLLGISTAQEIAKSYMDDVISLVLGTFILALAVERYNLHKRLALNVSTQSLKIQEIT